MIKEKMLQKRACDFLLLDVVLVASYFAFGNVEVDLYYNRSMQKA